MSDTVKKQHYIWREYLTRWSDSGDRLKGKVYVLRKIIRGNQKTIEFRELEKIGFEKYYYDMTGVKEKDLIIMNQLLSYMQRNELVKLGVNKNNLIISGMGGVNTLTPPAFNRRVIIEAQ